MRMKKARSDPCSKKIQLLGKSYLECRVSLYSLYSVHPHVSVKRVSKESQLMYPIK